MLLDAKRIAMQYSPNNDIMYVSMVDAGTVEFLRSLGKEIVTSADLVSQFEAVLTEDQIASHAVAQRAIDAIVAEAWLEIGRRLRPAIGPASRSSTEYDMVLWLREAMRREGLVWENGPDVSVNANTSDSHYEPTADRAAPIREGDFLLIDIWGRSTRRQASTTTSPGPASSAASLPQKNSSSSTTVRHARDAAIALVEHAFAAESRRSVASKPTMPPAPSSAPPASPNSSPTAPATTSRRRFTAPARTSTTSKPTTRAASCPTPASPSSPEFISPSSACAAKST